MDPKDVVRSGYDAISERYRGDRDAPDRYAPWIGELRRRLPPRADVLDLGCGCGVPTARELAGHGHRVVGVDASAVQVERARRLVPSARFVQADAAGLRYDDGAFDAVVALYVLIHLPQDEQRQVIADVARWLRPGGVLLATVGVDELTGEDPDWLGAGHRMWWSHPPVATSRAWFRDAGLRIERDEFVAEGDGGHQLLVGVRPGSAPDDPLAGKLSSVLVHGLQPVVVRLSEHDPDWAGRFAGRAAELRRVLGDRARTVEHVGSTAVPGLAAKPTVDIAVGVDDPDDEPAYLPDLLTLGYDLRVREPGHRCLRAGEPDATVNLHCYRPDDPAMRRYVLFRDRLRADPDDRALYERTKRALADREWPDMNYYAEAKGPVIAEILARAGWTPVGGAQRRR